MLTPDRLAELRHETAAELLAEITAPCNADTSGRPCTTAAVWVASVRCTASNERRRGALCDRHASEATQGRMLCRYHDPAHVALLALERL